MSWSFPQPKNTLKIYYSFFYLHRMAMGNIYIPKQPPRTCIFFSFFSLFALRKQINLFSMPHQPFLLTYARGGPACFYADPILRSKKIWLASPFHTFSSSVKIFFCLSLDETIGRGKRLLKNFSKKCFFSQRLLPPISHQTDTVVACFLAYNLRIKNQIPSLLKPSNPKREKRGFEEGKLFFHQIYIPSSPPLFFVLHQSLDCKPPVAKSPQGLFAPSYAAIVVLSAAQKLFPT